MLSLGVKVIWTKAVLPMSEGCLVNMSVYLSHSLNFY